jgi:hypothetical protein
LQQFEIIQYSFSFAYNKIRDKAIRKEMFGCAKNIMINDLKESDIKSTPTLMKTNNKEFNFFISNKNYLIMSCSFSKEKVIDSLNSLFVKVFEELKKSWKDELEVTVIAQFTAKINAEIKPFHYLVNQATIKKFYQNEDDFSVKRMEIWQPPSEKLRKGFYFREEKFGTIMDCIRSNVYKNEIPSDVGTTFILELRNQADTFFTQLLGESCS